MSAIWVDTDYGFDDLWALLVLRRFGADIAALSLVAGNAALPRVMANALGGRAAYGLDAPLFAGADCPLQRPLETAERVLGPLGMASRGRHLPAPEDLPELPAAVPALADWLEAPQPGDATPRVVLALGPLTNIARLIQQAPDRAARITRLIWMGGSAGPGNHSPLAEFNALADPEAAAIVAGSGIPMDVIDLMLCRQVVFGPADMPAEMAADMPADLAGDMPADSAATDPLTADLLGGYLDIGLSRGRAGMAIYDPVAALAAVRPEAFAFTRCRMEVSTVTDDSYGATRFTPDAAGRVRLATDVSDDCAALCLSALATESAHGC